MIAYSNSMEETGKKQRGGARKGAGRKPRFPGGTEMIRIPSLMKAEVIAFIDVFGECAFEGRVPKSRSDEATRKKLVEDMKKMIVYERNRLEEKAKEFDNRRQKKLFDI